MCLDSSLPTSNVLGNCTAFTRQTNPQRKVLDSTPPPQVPRMQLDMWMLYINDFVVYNPHVILI